MSEYALSYDAASKIANSTYTHLMRELMLFNLRVDTAEYMARTCAGQISETISSVRNRKRGNDRTLASAGDRTENHEVSSRDSRSGDERGS